MSSDGGSVGRRHFTRHIADDQLAALAERLRERGVPEYLIEREHDLSGLAAEINIRGTVRLSLLEAAAEAGLEPTEARQVWSTAGVAVGEDDDPAFTPDDVAVLRFYAAGRDLFGATAVLQVLRVVGSSFARIAEAETTVLRLNFEVPYLDAGGSDTDVMDGYERISRMLLPAVEHIFPSLHRIHLTRAARRGWTVDEEGGATLAAVTVGFADLAGFTSLSGQVSPSELAGIVDAFDEHVSDLVLAHGGRVVKLIGDEVMFAADDTADGLRIAEALARGLPGAEHLPAVRVGAACGEVLNRDGDYYGSVVNLAARLVALAEPGEVLVDAALAAVAGEAGVVALDPVDVKGFPDPITPFRLLG